MIYMLNEKAWRQDVAPRKHFLGSYSFQCDKRKTVRIGKCYLVLDNWFILADILKAIDDHKSNWNVNVLFELEY